MELPAKVGGFGVPENHGSGRNPCILREFDDYRPFQQRLLTLMDAAFRKSEGR